MIKFNKNKNFPFNVRNFVPDIEMDRNDPKLIRVISYNILCDSLVSVSTQIQEEDINKLPYMQWENRRNKILMEINELNADIICIQEFERDKVFIEEMAKNNYDVYLII